MTPMRQRGSEASATADTADESAAWPVQLERRRFVSWLGWAWLAIPISGLLTAACGSEGEGGSTATKGASAAGGAEGDASSREASAPSAKSASPSSTTPANAPPAGSKPAPEAAAATPDENALVTEIPAMASLVKSVNYAHESPKPDQSCANCQLYTASEDGLGDCKLFAQGLVEAQGWCTSWIKRATA